MNGKKIRIVLLCKGYEFESWAADCIREVLRLPFVEIVLLVAEVEEEKPRHSFFSRLRNYPYKHFLWRYYKRFRLNIPAFETINLQEEFQNVALIHVKPELKGKYSQHFSAADISILEAYQPDVILRFAFNILRGEILTVAPYGVWSYHHADEQVIRGGPAAFWEIYNRMPVTAAILQRLTGKLDAGIILRKGYFPTIARSYKANLEQLLNGSASWMKQALIDLKNGLSPAMSGTPVSSAAPVYMFPNNWQMLRGRFIAGAAKHKFHRDELFRPESWNVGIVKQTPEEILSKGITNDIEWLPEPKANEYYADPFGWEENGALKIVFEHYQYAKEKGSIAGFTKEEGIRTLKEKNEHLSYPFVLTQNGERFILPECHVSQQLFSFPVKNVSEETVLMKNIIAVDASPVFYKDRWWLFCTESIAFSNSQLFIYHATDFKGPWTAHENNPVKCDARSARPGGTPFVRDGKLFRPAQDCSTSYGAAVLIQEVDVLNETAFAEQTVARLEAKPDWKFNKGLHTFSVVNEKLVLIDAKRYRFNFDNFRHVLKRKLKRLLPK